MPPLHAPPGDDDVWGPEDEPEEGRRGRGRWVVIAAALLLLLLGGGAYYVLTAGNRGSDGGDTTASATTGAGPTDVFLDSSRYVGRPVADVEAELDGMGLVVALRMATTDQLEQIGRAFQAGTVVALEPTDRTVPTQSTVTVFYVKEAYSPAEEEPEPTTEAPPPTTAAPTTGTTAPTTTTPPTTAPTTTTTLGGTTTSDTPPPVDEPAKPTDEEPVAAPE
jgi:serine/threonine-protein kinase